jgi:hypothetical protein
VTDQADLRQLVCAECGARSDACALEWRAYLDDEEAAVVFCPDCARREFEPDD